MFLHNYCRAQHCAPADYQRRVLNACLYPAARVLAPFINLIAKDFFAPDRALVDAVAHCTTMAAIREEMHHYFINPENAGFLRSKAKLRLSTKRLQHLAAHHL